MNRLVYVKWKDALRDEADNGQQPQAELAILEEVGWFLHETDEAIQIGMEREPAEADRIGAGRWRLSIPKVGILELRIVEWQKAFPKRSIIR